MGKHKIYLLLVYLLALYADSFKVKEGNAKGIRFMVLPERYSHKEAEQKCTSEGISWGLPDSQSYVDDLEQTMKQNGIQTVWLNLYKRQYPTWTWVDGSTYKVPLDSTRYKCAGLTLQGERIRNVGCGGSGIGFVCQLPVCPEKYLTQNCINHKGKWFLVGCSSHGWHDARSYCQRRNGNLAVVPNREDQQVIFQYLTEKKLYDKCSWLYIGLSKEDWFTSTPIGNSTPVNVYWDKDQPRTGSCAVAKFHSGKLFWDSTPCDNNHGTICQNYNFTMYMYTSSINETTRTDTCQNGNSCRLKEVFLILLGLTTLLAVVYFVVRLGIRICKWQSDIKVKQPPLLKPAKNMRTVVIIFPSIQSWVEKNMVAAYKNIQWINRKKKKVPTATLR